MLTIGNKGSEVIQVKQLLAKQGFWTDSQDNPVYTAKLSSAIAYFQQTHLNESGDPCTVDGNVGPETLWALKHSTGKAQISGLADNQIPAGIGEQRTRILEVALAQHGIKEVPNGSNRGTKPNGGVDKFLPDWTKKPGKKGPSWCCFFISWVTKEAFGKYPMGRIHGSCNKVWKAAESMDKAFYVPKHVLPGDAFVLLHDDGTGHIGFVYNISKNLLEFNTIEGNCGNRVKIGTRSFGDVHGFISFCDDDPDDFVNFEHKLITVDSVKDSGTR